MSKWQLILWNLATALAYLGCGRLGLLLALENGYASPIWPPAGLALAAVLLKGRGIWPGLFLGAFLTNSNLEALMLDPIASVAAHKENLVIAFGNTLQPLTGAWLLGRFAQYPNELCAAKDVLRFYLYSGPVSCIVAATVGTLSLYYGGTIIFESMQTTWLVWWIGDTTGVLIFTPLLVSLVFLRSAPRRYLTLALALILAFSVTIVFAFQTRNWERVKLDEMLRSLTQAIGETTESLVKDNLGALDSLASFIKLVEPITREQFESFAAAEIAQNTSIMALSWNPLVLPDQRAAVERRLAHAYPGHDKIFDDTSSQDPAPPNRRYVPVLFIFPLHGNAQALGFNVWSHPTRREAMTRSALNGGMEATAPIKLVQQNENGILIFNPVFRGGQLLGYATAVIKVSNLLTPALSRFTTNGLVFRLYDVTDSSRELMSEFVNLASPSAGRLRQTLRHKANLSIGNRQWELDIVASDDFVSEHHDRSAWLLLLSGSLLTGVLGILILTLTGRELLTQRAIEESTHELIEANQAKSNFLANMSHEIRTPMNGIIAMTELLMKTETTEEQYKYLDIVRTSSTALLVIINDILDFSKIEAGKLTLENIPFDLLRTVEEVGDLMSESAHAKGLEFAIVVDHQLPRSLYGDPGRLRQILLNLVNNAIKFTEKGSVVLEVQNDEDFPRFLRVRFQVTDSGIGMSLEQQRNLFRAFIQGDSSMTRKFGGTGLGLAISKELIENMGGVIAIESSPNTGSRFRAQIPLQKDLAGYVRDSEADNTVPLARTLVVDRQTESRKAVIEHLRCAGVQAQEAMDSQSAYQLIARAHKEGHPYQAIIWGSNLDLSELPSDAPVIIVGPLSQQDQSPHIFLPKPIKRKDLLAGLEQLLTGKPPQPAPMPKPKTAPPEPTSAHARILLVEDNRTNQKVATFMLKKLGFACTIAENGFSALETLARERFDLVFMDCQMPELDGFETTRRIRAEVGPNQSVAIVAMTANALKGDRERCLEVGMNDYLAKPVKSEDLKRTLIHFGLLTL